MPKSLEITTEMELELVGLVQANGVADGVRSFCEKYGFVFRTIETKWFTKIRPKYNVPFTRKPTKGAKVTQNAQSQVDEKHIEVIKSDNPIRNIAQDFFASLETILRENEILKAEREQLRIERDELEQLFRNIVKYKEKFSYQTDKHGQVTIIEGSHRAV